MQYNAIWISIELEKAKINSLLNTKLRWYACVVLCSDRLKRQLQMRYIIVQMREREAN